MTMRSSKAISKMLVLAVAVGVSGCSAAGAAHSDGSIPVQAIRLAARAHAGLSGKIVPSEEVRIVSKLSGKVAAVHVQEGDKVKKGDILVQLETDDLNEQLKQAEAGLIAAEAKLSDTRNGARAQEIQGLESAVQAAKAASDQAEASFEQAKANLDYATKMYNKLRNLFDSNSSVTQEEMDQGTLDYEKARTAYEQAEAMRQSAAAQATAAQAKLDLALAGPTENTVKALQAEVDRLQAGLQLAAHNLNNATIIAPTDGIVINKTISPGEMAQAGIPLVTLVNMDQVEVELSVADNQIGSIKTGSPVEVKVVNVADRRFEGTISYVSPVANANSSTFPVKVQVDNPEGLLFAGMIAEVHLAESGQEKLEVPVSAVLQSEGREYVVIVDNGTARRVEVKTEPKNSEWVYAASGEMLKSGQWVVVHPDESIADGAKLRVE